MRVRRSHGRSLVPALVVIAGVALMGFAIAERVVSATGWTTVKPPSLLSEARVPHGRLYGPASPFNRPIPENAPTDPQSAEYVAGLAAAASDGGFVIAVGRYTVPAYIASARTPRYRVALTASWAPRHTLVGVPIPPVARPDPSDDGHLAIVDSSTRCEYDFWKAQKKGQTWTAAWGNAISETGQGVYSGGLSARGSGFALLAGLIWPDELARRQINHALIFSYPYTSGAGFVSPATESDGQSDRPDAMPEGVRLQLDLRFDTSSLPKYERTIARALQRYGMYLADTSGSVGNIGLYAVNPESYRRNPYAGLLPSGDYVDIRDIPIDRFRVIEHGPIRRNRQLAIRLSRCAKRAQSTVPQ